MFNSALIYEMAVLKIYAQPQLLAIRPGMPGVRGGKAAVKTSGLFSADAPRRISATIRFCGSLSAEAVCRCKAADGFPFPASGCGRTGRRRADEDWHKLRRERKGKGVMTLDELKVGQDAVIQVGGRRGRTPPPSAGYGADAGHGGNPAQDRAHGRPHRAGTAGV